MRQKQKPKYCVLLKNQLNTEQLEQLTALIEKNFFKPSQNYLTLSPQIISILKNGKIIGSIGLQEDKVNFIVSSFEKDFVKTFKRSIGAELIAQACRITGKKVFQTGNILRKAHRFLARMGKRFPQMSLKLEWGKPYSTISIQKPLLPKIKQKRRIR